MQRIVIEYMANAVWLIPLLAGTAWLLVWAMRAGARVQHGVWLTALVLAVVLPAYGTRVSIGQDVIVADAVGNEAALRAIAATTRGASVSASGHAASGESAAEAGRAAWTRDKDVPESPSGFATWPPRVHSVRLAASAAYWLVAVYVLVVAYSVFRLARGWCAARRLLRHSRTAALSVEVEDALEELSARLDIAAPEVRASDEIAGPVVIGARRPVLLMPEGFLVRREDEVRAALLHELAHVKRHDYLVNLLCRAMALPVAWHPATAMIERRIARTREMVCDAIAADGMESRAGYARCLLAMARGMVGTPEMIGLFGDGALEERVTRLMEKETRMSMRTKVVRAVGGVVATVAALAVGFAFHVVPVLGQQSGVARPAADPIEIVATVAPVKPAAPSAPAAPPTPAVPPAPAVQSAPATPPIPAKPAAPAIPAVPPAPVVSRQEGSVSQDEHGFVIVDGERREMTPEERARAEKELATAHDELEREMKRIQSPEFKQQIEEAQRQALEMKKKAPEIAAQVAKAQADMRQMQARMDSGEFQRDIDAATRSIPTAEQMAEMRRQIQEEVARVNSPEFRKQLEEINSGAIQKELENLPKTIDTGAMTREMQQSLAEIERSQREMKVDPKVVIRVHPQVDIHPDPKVDVQPAPSPQPK